MVKLVNFLVRMSGIEMGSKWLFFYVFVIIWAKTRSNWLPQSRTFFVEWRNATSRRSLGRHRRRRRKRKIVVVTRRDTALGFYRVFIRVSLRFEGERERERERASRRLVSKATGAGSGELRSKPKTICRVSSLRWNLNPVFLSNFTEKPRLSLSRCHYRARFGTFFSPLLRF